MKNNNRRLLLLVFSLVFLSLNGRLDAQVFINPYIGYGVTKLNYPLSPLEIYNHMAIPIEVVNEGLISKDDKLYSPKIYVGFSIVKPINEYWGIGFQSDISYQKFSRQDHSFIGRNGAYFWYFRNSIIPTLNIGEKWKVGIGLNFDYSDSNHSHYSQIKDEVEFGGILQATYQLNKYFNLHLNYRHGLKRINSQIQNIFFDPLQSLNLGLGYRFQIKKK